MPVGFVGAASVKDVTGTSVPIANPCTAPGQLMLGYVAHDGTTEDFWDAPGWKLVYQDTPNHADDVVSLWSKYARAEDIGQSTTFRALTSHPYVGMILAFSGAKFGRYVMTGGNFTSLDTTWIANSPDGKAGGMLVDFFTMDEADANPVSFPGSMTERVEDYSATFHHFAAATEPLLVDGNPGTRTLSFPGAGGDFVAVVAVAVDPDDGIAPYRAALPLGGHVALGGGGAARPTTGVLIPRPGAPR